MNSSQLIETTKKWIGEFIIEFTICPFAKEAVIHESIGFEVLELSMGLDQILKDHLLSFSKSDQYRTSFLIFPELTSFDALIELYWLIDEINVDAGLEKRLSFVAFHPESRYENMDPLEPVNFANRSPYPMVQILRMSELEQLNLSEKDKNGILEHNHKVLSELGFEFLKKKLNAFTG